MSKARLPGPVNVRDWAQLPPTEFHSAFTLQTKNPVGVSFASGTDRFARDKPSAYYASTTAEPSSFRPNNPHHKPKVPPKEDVPQHRPLWLSEIRKEVPSGATYEIESTFGSKNTILRTKAATFKNGYEKYSRTCDIQSDIKIFNAQADSKAAGIASYDIEKGLFATKKRNPAYSQSRAKQFVLWDAGK